MNVRFAKEFEFYNFELNFDLNLLFYFRHFINTFNIDKQLLFRFN